MKWVKGVEDLNIGIIRAQGIVAWMATPARPLRDVRRRAFCGSWQAGYIPLCVFLAGEGVDPCFPRQVCAGLKRLYRRRKLTWPSYCDKSTGKIGRLCQTCFRRPLAGAAIPWPLLHSSGHHFQSSDRRYKDYAHGSKHRAMSLSAVEFLRRFFLHVLPKGFVRIRHFGFLANRWRRSACDLSSLLGCHTRTSAVARRAIFNSRQNTSHPSPGRSRGWAND
jgi:hypothetical protein